MKLYIGNQNYSSWSMRAWLIFFQCNVQTDVIKLKLFTDDFYQDIKKISPVGKVPALVDDEVVVWDSLAILEYINDEYLNGSAWPENKEDKAKARAVSAEMHSGFPGMRNELSMNCNAVRKTVVPSEDTLKEIERVDQMWSEQMSLHPGRWLFGEWSIADAMYAPLAIRFQTYGIELSEKAQEYQRKVLSSQAVRLWFGQAATETDTIGKYEVA
ncbi:glutathione S-transferase family protein [Vibrio salinus]|uniref:glutathione S-transferase family protein n=1 Tax=Vibrio salinus TaxID=2899784 RepID=UPI001E566354|nr:glutathione S-transferase family protein [Vibrio salinus]MCE0495617.1 glutathione S-transferase family protein [Vibrio salinus]